ncbi:MAG: branched-chain amino acid transaminase [bacterium]|nr:branched-chain amino acid transaminase [bacterium]
METTDLIWMNGKLLPWEKAQTHVLTHGLHYGSAVFEGTRVYKTPQGPAIFRLKDHTKRLLYSAKTMGMNVPYSEAEINMATLETVRRNKLKQGYIRPIIYYGYGKMGLNPIGAPVEMVIACWPWGKYLDDRPIRVQISDIVRIHPKSSVTDAKISGHYTNSIMAVLSLDPGFDEALLLDFKGNIAEGPGENFFMVKKGVLYTPKLGTILAGITRDTIFQLAADHGLKVLEKTLKPTDVLKGDEAFFTGTAAEVTAIGSINGKKIGNGKMGPVTTTIQQAYMDVVKGKNKKYERYLSRI